MSKFWVEKTLVRNRLDRKQGPDRLGAALWSPQTSSDGRDVYANMRDVSPGDVVFHLTDNEAFTGVSQVAAPLDTSFTGVSGTEWSDRPCYRIELADFRQLQPPLRREMFFSDQDIEPKLTAVLSGPRGRGLFFNDKLELNQGGYLTSAPSALILALDAAYRKHADKPLLTPAEQAMINSSEMPLPTAQPRLTGEDIRLLPQSGQGLRFAELSLDQRAAYQRIDAALRHLGSVVQSQLGGQQLFPVKLTSGFNVQSGVRGALPKDLWFGVYNAANFPDLVGMPQLFAIVSKRGVEYGFAPAIHPSDFSQQGIKDKVREAAPTIFARLPSPASEKAADLAAVLEQSGGWKFRNKARLDSGGSEFDNLPDWLSYLQSEKGQRWAGGSISRYVTAEQLDEPSFDLEANLAETARTFASLMREVTSMMAPQVAVSEELALEDAVPPVNELPIEDATIPERPPYPIERAMEGLFIDQAEFERWRDVWRSKRNLLLQGPPGVGKSFVARRLAYALIGYEDPSRVAMVQFHQSYSYEDFVQGFRPKDSGGFELQDGAFVAFCRRALADSNESYVFIIDEINRGNLSKILGEMMLLIEPDKRHPRWATRLAYAQEGKQGCATLAIM